MIRTLLFLLVALSPLALDAQAQTWPENVTNPKVVQEPASQEAVQQELGKAQDFLNGAVKIAQEKVTPAPDVPPLQLSVLEARDEFHAAAIQGAHRAMESGLITRQEFRRFRVAMFSPAYRADVQLLAETQLAFHDSDDIPRDASGALDRQAVDWPGITAFLMAMMPYFMELLKIFLGGGFGLTEFLMLLAA